MGPERENHAGREGGSREESNAIRSRSTETDDPTPPPELSTKPSYYAVRCHIRHPPRIAEAVSRRLVEKSVGAEADGRELVLQLPEGEQQLSRRAATKLRDELTAALTGRQAYLRTAGEHRADGSYVVSRVTADSAGHAKQFRDFRALEALYERLPERFDAENLGAAATHGEERQQPALSGSRRHLVLRHFVEHPAFDCELVSRQPLTARKTEPLVRETAESDTVETEVAPMD